MESGQFSGKNPGWKGGTRRKGFTRGIRSRSIESKEGRGMSRKFWTPVIVGSALLIALTGLWIGAVQSDLLSVEPRNNSVINYPAFPSDGGPYLVAATYWPDGGGADPELILVFNEALNASAAANMRLSISFRTSPFMHPPLGRSGSPCPHREPRV